MIGVHDIDDLDAAMILAAIARRIATARGVRYTYGRSLVLAEAFERWGHGHPTTAYLQSLLRRRRCPSGVVVRR